MKQAVKHFFTKKKLGALIVLALIGCFAGIAAYRMLHAAPVYGIDTMGDLGAVRDQYAAQLSSETAVLYDEGRYWSCESEYVSTMRGRAAYNVTFDDIAEHQLIGADERYRAFADCGSVYQKQSDTKPFAFYRAYLIRVGDPKIWASTIEITGACPEDQMLLGYLKTEYRTPTGNIRIRYIPLNAENDQLHITLKNMSKDGILKGIYLFLAEKENADLELHLQDRDTGMNLRTTY